LQKMNLCREIIGDILDLNRLMLKLVAVEIGIGQAIAIRHTRNDPVIDELISGVRCAVPLTGNLSDGGKVTRVLIGTFNHKESIVDLTGGRPLQPNFIFDDRGGKIIEFDRQRVVAGDNSCKGECRVSQNRDNSIYHYLISKSRKK